MGKFWADFKTFITKGNILDLAVGVVVGGAFGKITSSLVADIIMPVISLAVGRVDVTDWKIVLQEAILDEAGAVKTAEVAIRYGNFIQVILDFLIISLCIFAVVRGIRKAEAKMNEEETKKAAEAKAKADAEAKAKADEAKAAADAAAAKAEAERQEELQLLRDIAKSLKK